MANPIDNTEDVIDSRDVIARIEELEADLEERHEQGGFMSDFDDWIKNSRDDSTPVHAAFPDDGKEVQDMIEELYNLREFASEAEGTPDWIHGETLIREDYFTTYTEELVKDCYTMPKDMESGKWPWKHLTFDWESAAEELKGDYFEADFNGVTYYVRN